MYLYERRMDEVPDEDIEEALEDAAPVTETDAPEKDDDEAVIEEVSVEAEKETPPPKMKSVEVEEWVQLNAQPPVWARYVSL